MGILKAVAEVAGYITGIAAAVCLLVKPVRDKILGLNDIREGQRCIMRDKMLSIYYKNHEDNSIRQYEFENFVYLYKAYKKMGGNSFVDHIYKEVQTWEVYT